MNQESKTDLNWVDNSPRFDTLLKALFAVIIISFCILKACQGDVAVLNP